MDELRELILTYLDEFQETGVAVNYIELYRDMVMQCNTIEELLDFAAVELQLESADFFTDFKNQAEDLFSMQAGDDENALEIENSDGFGNEDSYIAQEDKVDPEMVELQQALQRTLFGDEGDVSDPDYFNIDDLLSKGDLRTQSKVVYEDELADLLSTYPVSNETSDDFEKIPDEDFNRLQKPDTTPFSGFDQGNLFAAKTPFGTQDNVKQPPSYTQPPFSNLPPPVSFGFPQDVDKSTAQGVQNKSAANIFAGFPVHKSNQ